MYQLYIFRADKNKIHRKFIEKMISQTISKQFEFIFTYSNPKSLHSYVEPEKNLKRVYKFLRDE